MDNTRRAIKKLQWWNRHGQAGLMFASARVRCMKLCSCGAKYTLYNLPHQCTGTRDGRRCTVLHFGDWARINYFFEVHARQKLKTLKGLTSHGS